jgi:hypothetical protein
MLNEAGYVQRMRPISSAIARLTLTLNIDDCGVERCNSRACSLQHFVQLASQSTRPRGLSRAVCAFFSYLSPHLEFQISTLLFKIVGSTR